MIELVVVVIYWTECMPRKFGNEIRLPGTIGIDNLPIPLTTFYIWHMWNCITLNFVTSNIY